MMLFAVTNAAFLGGEFPVIFPTPKMRRSGKVVSGLSVVAFVTAADPFPSVINALSRFTAHCPSLIGLSSLVARFRWGECFHTQVFKPFRFFLIPKIGSIANTN